MFEVNLIAVVVAAVVNMIIGFVWYAPPVFGRAWMRMTGVTPEMAEQGKRKMPLMAFFGFVAALLMAYILSHFAIAWGVFDVIGAVELGFWVWLGFMLPILLGSVLWDGKPVKLLLINAGYWLVGAMVMATILLLMA